MDDNEQFEKNKAKLASEMKADANLQRQLIETYNALDSYDYLYQQTWLGLPIIQSPSDVLVQQEIISRCRPTVIIETGIARGGSLIFLASMLKLTGGRLALGIDIDIREHNRQRIDAHFLRDHIELVQGPSTAPEVISQVQKHLRKDDRVMVILDSNHEHDHVRGELDAYSVFVTPGQYLVVADTIIEFVPPHPNRSRPWSIGNNPYTAMVDFMKENEDFEIDESVDAKLALSCNPRGYLKRR